MNEQMVGSEEIDIDFKDTVRFVARKWWILALAGIAAGVLMYVYVTIFGVVTYKSATSMCMLPQIDGSEESLSAELDAGASLIGDYMMIARSQAVLEEVSRRLQEQENITYTYDSLHEMTEVSKNASRVIVLNVVGENSEDVYWITSIWGEVAAETLSKLTDTMYVSVVNQAWPSWVIDAPSVSQDVFAAVLGGVFGAMIILVIIYMFDDKVKTAEDVSRYFGLPTLAVIPGEKESK